MPRLLAQTHSRPRNCGLAPVAVAAAHAGAALDMAMALGLPSSHPGWHLSCEYPASLLASPSLSEAAPAQTAKPRSRRRPRTLLPP